MSRRSEFIQMNSGSGGGGFTDIQPDARFGFGSGTGEEIPFQTGFMEHFGFVPPTSGTPLLSEESSTIPSLNNSFPGLPSSVTFSPAPDYENNPEVYCFHIKDASGCLLIKGSVRRCTGSVELQSTTGATFLFMIASSSPHSSSDRNAAGTQYEVRHQNKLLGRVSLCFTGCSFHMYNSVENMSYSVHSISRGDISICRSTSGVPICTIHMDSSYLQTSFSGSLVLSKQLPATRVEQCLCLAIAIAYTVERNKEKEVEEVEASDCDLLESICGCLLAVGVLFLICFGLWGILKILASSTCSSRYRESPNVKSKGCTSDGYPDWI